MSTEPRPPGALLLDIALVIGLSLLVICSGILLIDHFWPMAPARQPAKPMVARPSPEQAPIRQITVPPPIVRIPVIQQPDIQPTVPVLEPPPLLPAPPVAYDKPTGLRLLNNGTEMELSGPIGDGLAERFRRFLDTATQVRLVHLDSPGGRVAEAEKIAAMVHRHGLDTYARRLCASACTLIFLAGNQRWLDNYAIVGFHSPSSPLNEPNAARNLEAARNVIRRAFAADNVSVDFVEQSLATPPDQLLHPPLTQLITLNVATGFISPLNVGLSGFGPDPQRDAVVVRLDRQPGVSQLRRLDRQWSAVEDAWFDAVQNGKPPGDFEWVLRDHARRFGLQPPSLLANGFLVPDIYVPPPNSDGSAFQP